MTFHCVQGLGRCGTTFTWQALSHGFEDHEFYQADLPMSDARSGVLYKNHRYAPESMPGGKVLFLFGDPLHIVLSLLQNFNNPDALQAHAHHLGVPQVPKSVDKLISKDMYDLAGHWDSWTQPQRDYNVLCVRYETMYEHRCEIEEFMGVKGNWPPWVVRHVHFQSRGVMGWLRRTYGGLSKKIKAAGDIVLL